MRDFKTLKQLNNEFKKSLLDLEKVQHKIDNLYNYLKNDLKSLEIVMQEMKKILDEEYTRTLKLLTENKQKLEKIVHALLEKESLTEAEFYKLLSEQK